MNEKDDNTSMWSSIGFFILLLGVVCLFFWGVAATFKYLDSPALSSTIAVSGTVMVAVITVVVAKYIENKQKINHEIRQKKTPIYERHIGTIFSTFMGTKVENLKLTDEELLEAFVKFTKDVVLWGSADVIRAWGKMRVGYGNLDTTEQVIVLADLIRTLRKDVGISDDLTDKEILKLFINDIDEYLM